MLVRPNTNGLDYLIGKLDEPFMHGSHITDARLSSHRCLGYPPSMPVSFNDWIGERKISCIGTNAGSSEIAFQGWRRFKEAFAPELVARALQESSIPVARCLDPFGGSGTTALACQFLGISPVTIEVNPYLADLIEAKLIQYDAPSLRRAFSRIINNVSGQDVRSEMQRLTAAAPATIVQPGVNDRFVFFRDVLRRILAYRQSIKKLRSPAVRQFFHVLLASVAIPVSNVTVSGKGRRYRGGWQDRRPTVQDVDDRFAEIVSLALYDIERFGQRKEFRYSVLRGDARRILDRAGNIQLAVFSPPYPNSADYTDVYNVELWTMGYLRDWEDNRTLRDKTLSSHVQLKRQYAPPPKESKVLDDALDKLRGRRAKLWHPDIPEMIGAYFADMRVVLQSLHKQLAPGGKAYIVLGDSRYAKTTIPTAEIVSKIATLNGYSVLSIEPFRSMRVAPQQGGKPGLAESLLILSRCD